MATRTILFRGQTRRKGERTSISGIPLPGIWVAGGAFPQNKGYDYAISFYTPNLDEACDALNLYDIDYDLDDGDRIMVDDSFYDDVLDAFEEYDIEYEEV